MREPRPGLAWSPGRLAHRRSYAQWMASSQWQTLRRRWATTWAATHHHPPVCAGCDTPWDLRRDDLHHRSYQRLGHEHPTDLVAVCRTCHRRLHRIIESTPAWRRMPRTQATDHAIAHIRRTTTTPAPPPHPTTATRPTASTRGAEGGDR